MKYHYVWLIWSSAFLVPWAILYLLSHMSVLMDRMSFLQGRPAMRDSEFQKQMEPMRKQMDEMMRNPSANSKTKRP